MKVTSTYAIRDLPKIIKPTNVICKECFLTKWKKITFSNNNFTTTTKLEIVCIDLSGPKKTRGIYDENYFKIIVDDFTRIMWVAFLKENFKAFEKFNFFNNRIENESMAEIKWWIYSVQ